MAKRKSKKRGPSERRRRRNSLDIMVQDIAATLGQFAELHGPRWADWPQHARDTRDEGLQFIRDWVGPPKEWVVDVPHGPGGAYVSVNLLYLEGEPLVRLH